METISSAARDANSIVHCHSGGAWVAKLEESIQQSKLAVSLFSAAWSAPSKVMHNSMVDLSKAYPDVMFLQVDTEEVKDMTARMGVRMVPTTILVQKGKEVERIKSVVSVESLEQKIISHLTI